MLMDPAGDVLLAFTTAPDREVGERLAHTLVEERLIACANLVPGLHSVYRWEGRICSEPEVLLVMKTARPRLPALKERLPELHPYDVPELVALPLADGLEAYCRWVLEETVGKR